MSRPGQRTIVPSLALRRRRRRRSVVAMTLLATAGGLSVEQSASAAAIPVPRLRMDITLAADPTFQGCCEIVEPIADPVRDIFYAVTDASDAEHPQSLVVIDQQTATVVRSKALDAVPADVAVAGDGSGLFMSWHDERTVTRLSLPDLRLDWTAPMPYLEGSEEVAVPLALASVPGNPDAVVVAYAPFELEFARGLIFVEGGMASPNRSLAGGPTVAFAGEPTGVWAYGNGRLNRSALTADGFEPGTAARTGAYGAIAGATGSLLVMTDGTVIDTAGGTSVAGRVDGRVSGVDAQRGLAYVWESELWRIVDVATRVTVDEWVIPATAGSDSGALDDGVGWRDGEDELYLFYPDDLRRAAGEYTAVTPARILDTRSGLGRPQPGPVRADRTIDVQVTGLGGVPATDVWAVVLNVTAVEPTRAGFLTIWPSDRERPVASSLNFAPQQVVANLVTVPVGADGSVSVYNAYGDTHVLFDVAGFYAAAEGQAGSRYRAVAPRRLLDTRTGQGDVPVAPLDAGSTLTFDITGRAGVAADGVDAVVVNLTATDVAAPSFLSMYPADVRRPEVSNLNLAAGSTVANQVIVRVPEDGRLTVYNRAGSTHVIVDVVGYFDQGRADNTGRFIPFEPFRALDTREDSPFPPPGSLVSGDILYWGSPDDTASGYAVNVTVTGTTGPGFVRAYPYPGDPPSTSTVNYGAGATVPNHAIVGAGPYLGFQVSGGSTHLIVDVFGVFT